MSDHAGARNDREAHKRYLEYRDRHAYFGKNEPLLSLEAYVPLEKELAELEAKGEGSRDDDEEARYAVLAKSLFRD